MQKVQLKAQPRTIVGREVKSLRRQGLLPAVVYGRGFSTLNLQVPRKEFEKVYAEAGESTLVYLDVAGEQYPTIIHAVVRDPLSDILQHADFYKVNLAEKIHAKIPLVFKGEAPAVKELGGILVKNINEIEVEGLPQDLPHEIVVDITKLVQFNSHITLGDLAIATNLTVTNKLEEVVALVQEPISEEELKAQLETPAATAEEVEVIKKEKPEGEPAEGEAPAAPAEDKK